MSQRPEIDSEPPPRPATSDVAPAIKRALAPENDPVTEETPIDGAASRAESGVTERESGNWPGGWALEEGSGERHPPFLDAPSPDRVPRVLVRLSREVRTDMQDEEIVHAFVEAMRELFPGRRFAVRLIAPVRNDIASAAGASPAVHIPGAPPAVHIPGALPAVHIPGAPPAVPEISLFYASGRLAPNHRSPLLLEASAAERHSLDAAEIARAGVTLTPSYVPFFEPGADGFDVPLTDGTRLLGVLSAEVPRGQSMPPWDAPVLVPLGLEMASKLKSARLLRESNYLRDYLAQVIERANAPIVVIGAGADRRRLVEKVNLAFLQVTGSTREHWVGADFVARVAEADRARAIEAVEAAHEGIAMSDVELRLPRSGGGSARVAFNTASIVSHDGEVTGIVAIGRDLTKVRDLEEQIIQAEKLATLGQLAAGVVHELNNPLTSISVYSEYLLNKARRGAADPGDIEKLARISDASARMLRFTRDLVTYARPSSEEPSLLSMGEVIDQALVFCDHVVHESKVAIERRYGEGLPRLWAVRGQLHQVFINLVTNACHAMAGLEQAGRLTVSIEPDSLHTDPSRDPGAPLPDLSTAEGLCVSIEDNGPGIASEHADHIFEPFFTTKGEGRGTGLGLSIVRNIVSQHGGTVSMRTRHGTPPTGTTFVLRFPLDLASRSPGAPPSSAGRR